jgi:hypothetical protein
MANQRLNIDVVARDKTKQAFGNLQKGLGRLKQSVFNLQNAFIGLGVGLVARNLVNTGKNLENLRTRLKFLLKDTNEGAKAFENMTKFASQVPFSLEEIQSGSGILATVTDNADDLQQMLEITGNVAAVTGLDFRTAAEQIQRSFSAGIGAADLFREKGVRNMLGFKAGATVSIEETVSAFERVFAKGGRFGKATDELAETFEGTLSMVGDKILQFKFAILEAGLFESLKTEFGSLNDFMEENSKTIERIGTDIGIALGFAVTKVADGIKLLKDNMDKFAIIIKGLIAIKVVSLFLSLAKAIRLAAKQMAKFSIASLLSVKGLKGIAVLVAKGGAFYVAFKGIDKLFEEIEENFNTFADGVKNSLPDARDKHKIYKGVAKEVKEIVELTKREAGIIQHQKQELQTVSRIFKDLNEKALEDINSKMRNIKTIIAEGINNGITQMSQGFARALVFGESLKDTLQNMARNVLARIIAVLIEQIARQAVIIAMENTQIGQLATKLGIEKLITAEKMKQATSGTVSAGSSLMGLGSLKGFFGMAKGGAVSKGQPYIVGEQGAELFIPNQTGQITQNARGTNGGQTTVNFNINTLDASGFEDLLVRSRGTITSIINNAVNERGEGSII